MTVEAIWPPAARERVLTADNDRSTVARLNYQGRSILLSGDIADAAMAALLSRGDLKADVLALPHHGSVVWNTKRFIDAVDPSAAVRSSGERREATVNGIDKLVAGRTYFSMSDDGCVMVEIQNRVISASAVMREKQ